MSCFFNTILLNANASDLLPLRRWAETNYVALARRLLAAFDDVCIVFTGAPGEAPRTAELVRAVDSPRCLSAAGQTSRTADATASGSRIRFSSVPP